MILISQQHVKWNLFIAIAIYVKLLTLAAKISISRCCRSAISASDNSILLSWMLCKLLCISWLFFTTHKFSWVFKFHVSNKSNKEVMLGKKSGSELFWNRRGQAVRKGNGMWIGFSCLYLKLCVHDPASSKN